MSASRGGDGQKKSRTSLTGHGTTTNTNATIEPPPSTGRIRRSTLTTDGQKSAAMLSSLNQSPVTTFNSAMVPGSQRSPYTTTTTASVSATTLPATASNRSTSTTDVPPVKATKKTSSSSTKLPQPTPPVDLVQFSSTNMAYVNQLATKTSKKSNAGGSNSMTSIVEEESGSSRKLKKKSNDNKKGKQYNLDDDDEEEDDDGDDEYPAETPQQFEKNAEKNKITSTTSSSSSTSKKDSSLKSTTSTSSSNSTQKQTTNGSKTNLPTNTSNTSSSNNNNTKEKNMLVECPPAHPIVPHNDNVGGVDDVDDDIRTKKQQRNEKQSKTQLPPQATTNNNNNIEKNTNTSSSTSINTKQMQQQQQLQLNKPLPLVHPPYCRETYSQLCDTNTVPREVYVDYLKELRTGGPSGVSGGEKGGKSAPSHLVGIPKEVEGWTVKLPTRLEFQNITIRVMKKFPRPGSLTERIASGKNKKKRKVNPSAIHQQQIELEQQKREFEKYNKLYGLKAGGSTSGDVTPSTTASRSGLQGYEVDLDGASDIDSGDFRSGNKRVYNSTRNKRNKSQYDDDDDEEDDEEDDDGDDQLFSPSSFNRMNKGRQYHKAQAEHHIPGGGNTYEDSEDEDDGTAQGGGGLFGCLQDEFEERPITILDNLNGVIEPGSMVAILGGSGAGKTTLLNSLSGRIGLMDPHTTPRDVLFSDVKAVNSGSVLFNGTRVTEGELSSMCGYVMQNDVFLSTLSVRETLQFAAKLQLPPSISQERRDKRVQRVIEQLDLTHIAESPIGGMFKKGISGGQKRRVSVAIELIKDPNILFLDEPTSGLDATTAVNVMRVLKHLSQTGRTVIFTIHSPNSKILELFDTMILLSRGRLAYFGPAQKCMPYFSSLGYDCPLFSNAAEFFLNVLTPCTIAMYKTMLTNAHHTPEDMLTNMDPRYKTIILLRAALGYHYNPQQYNGNIKKKCNESILEITEQQKLKSIADLPSTRNAALMASTKASGLKKRGSKKSTNKAGFSPKNGVYNPSSTNMMQAAGKGKGIHHQVSTTQLVEFDINNNGHGGGGSGELSNHHQQQHKTAPHIDWTNQFLGYETTVQEEEWSVYINGYKQETLRQKRKRHLVEQQHKAYNNALNPTISPSTGQRYANSTNTLYTAKKWNFSLFPQSTHIYQQMLKPIIYDELNPNIPDPLPQPPPLNPAAVPSDIYQAIVQDTTTQPMQLYNIEDIVTERENRRLTHITDTYLKYPIQINHRYSPFLTNYVPKLRNLHLEGEVALQEIGFDTTNNKKIDLVQPGKAPLPWFEQFKTLTHRTFLNTIRDPLNTVMRVVVNLFLSFFVGMLFFQTGNYQYSIYAYVGFLFFLTSIQAFITVMGAVLTFSEERSLFIREYHKQIYDTSAYFLGKTVIDIIYQTILSILFGCLAYPMVGLPAGFGRWLKYTISIIMVAQGSSGYAFILGALCPYQTIALMLSPLTMTPFLMVSGFTCPLTKLSPVVAWLAWLSPQRWGFEALMTEMLLGFKFRCRDQEYITIPLDSGTFQRECPIISGNEVLTLFGMSTSPNTFVKNTLFGILIAVITKVIALFALKFSAWHHVKTSTGS